MQRLDGGNTWVGTGTVGPDYVPTRVFEVTPSKEKVWELILSGEPSHRMVGLYEPKKIPVLVGEIGVRLPPAP